MTHDECAIRELVDTWMEASKAGDIAILVGLMTDEVMFMTPGREPFGKEEFRASFEAMRGTKIDGRAEVREISVAGEWAWIHNYLEIAMAPRGGPTVHRSGHTLTILRKGSDGRWRLDRDANLVG